jgi:hypothetical protein
VDIRSFAEDAEGNLWVGTVGSGLFRLREGRVEHFGPAMGLTTRSARALWELEKRGLALEKIITPASIRTAMAVHAAVRGSTNLRSSSSRTQSATERLSFAAADEESSPSTMPARIRTISASAQKATPSP